MIVVDSSVWIDFFNATETPQTLWLKYSARPSQIAVNGLILCEVLQGAKSPQSFVTMQRALTDFAFVSGDDIASAVVAAANYRMLRSKGITIRKLADMMIATLCIRENCYLLHNDRDYDPFEQHLGLKVIHP